MPRPLYPRYPLDRRLGGPKIRSGRRGEEKILDPIGTRTPTPRSSSPLNTMYNNIMLACTVSRHLYIVLDLNWGAGTGDWLEDRGVRVRVPVGSRIFSFPRRPYRLWGPSSFLPNGYLGLFHWGVKRPGREADHSSVTSAEVKKTWIYTSTPAYVFMAWCLINHRGSFTFLTY
jgi:hypothetical protein